MYLRKVIVIKIKKCLGKCYYIFTKDNGVTI